MNFHLRKYKDISEISHRAEGMRARRNDKYRNQRLPTRWLPWNTFTPETDISPWFIYAIGENPRPYG